MIYTCLLWQISSICYRLYYRYSTVDSNSIIHTNLTVHKHTRLSEDPSNVKKRARKNFERWHHFHDRKRQEIRKSAPPCAGMIVHKGGPHRKLARRWDWFVIRYMYIYKYGGPPPPKNLHFSKKHWFLQCFRHILTSRFGKLRLGGHISSSYIRIYDIHCTTKKCGMFRNTSVSKTEKLKNWKTVFFQRHPGRDSP